MRVFGFVENDFVFGVDKGKVWIVVAILLVLGFGVVDIVKGLNCVLKFGD